MEIVALRLKEMMMQKYKTLWWSLLGLGQDRE